MIMSLPEVVVGHKLKVEESIVGIRDEGEVLSPIDPERQILNVESTEKHHGEQHHGNRHDGAREVHEHSTNQQSKPL